MRLDTTSQEKKIGLIPLDNKNACELNISWLFYRKSVIRKG